MSSELPSAEQVVAYLKAHKNFFVDHEALLADISIPHETGKAVSLVERQVVVLRERNVELRERLTHLLDVARENDVLFENAQPHSCATGNKNRSAACRRVGARIAPALRFRICQLSVV